IAGVGDSDSVVDLVAGLVGRAVENRGGLDDRVRRVVRQRHTGAGRLRRRDLGAGHRGRVVQLAVAAALVVQVGLGDRVAGRVDPRLAHVQLAVVVVVAAGGAADGRLAVALHLVLQVYPGGELRP